MNKVFGLIQARMGSKRLPGKALLPINGQPIIKHIIDRMICIEKLEGIILATTEAKENDRLSNYVSNLNVKVWREKEENDIASRLYNAAKYFKADAILKVNADCPLIDPVIMKRLLKEFSKKKYDYISNKLSWTFPKGMSCELINIRALKWCNQNLTDKQDRELVADWIKNNKNFFKVKGISSRSNYGRYDLMVDTKDDYKYMCKIFNSLYYKNKYFGFEEIKQYLNENHETT